MQKRRERINERLRILQNLVPNGTKVRESRAAKYEYNGKTLHQLIPLGFMRRGI